MKMKKFLKENVILVIWGVIVLVLLINTLIPIGSPKENVANKYTCNYKIALKTKIESVDKNGNEVTIKGDNLFFTKVEDPLAMYDSNDKIVCKADDDFDFLTQNNHAISKNGKCLYIMEGNFKLFGDTYTICDTNGNEVATAKFSWLGKGELKNNNNELLAQYNSRLGRRDYVVTIFEGNTMDVDAIQILFASYASDNVADSTN